jgi:hypothetical protein
VERIVDIQLSKVAPVPVSLRADPRIDIAAASTPLNLGALFLHHYFDSYPAAPPHPDPSRFEYLDLVSPAADFRFHDFVAHASTVKKRALSTELGQAFCRLMLQDHFGVTFFAHMGDVLDKPAHAALNGVRVKRASRGDVPDYLCSDVHATPFVAEAKGRFSTINFTAPAFTDWRQQFKRISVLDQLGSIRSVKGFIVATQFGTEHSRRKSCVYVEDPETLGELPIGDNAPSLGRFAAAIHYSYIFRKLGLRPLASALLHGFSLTRELQFQVPVWTCMTPPFQRRRVCWRFFSYGRRSSSRAYATGLAPPTRLGSGACYFHRPASENCNHCGERGSR